MLCFPFAPFKNNLRPNAFEPTKLFSGSLCEIYDKTLQKLYSWVHAEEQIDVMDIFIARDIISNNFLAVCCFLSAGLSKILRI